MKIKLKKSIISLGKEIDVIDLALEDLTGNDLIEAEKQVLQSGEAAVVTDFSRPYLVAVASRAAHLPIEALKFVGARDFTKITTEVRNFLLVQDSGENDEEKIPESSPAIS